MVLSFVGLCVVSAPLVSRLPLVLASAVCQPSQSATRVRPLVSLPLLPPSRRSTCSRTRASAPLCPYPCFPRFPLFLPSPANSPLSVCPFVPLLAPSRSLSLPLVPEESASDTLQRFSLRVKTKKVNLCFAFFRCSRKVYPFLFLPYVFPVSSLPHENSPLSSPFLCPRPSPSVAQRNEVFATKKPCSQANHPSARGFFALTLPIHLTDSLVRSKCISSKCISSKCISMCPKRAFRSVRARIRLRLPLG